MQLQLPKPPTTGVPSWVEKLAHGVPLPPEPTWRKWRDWGRQNAFLVGLSVGWGSAYLAYHFIRPLLAP